MFLFLGHLLVQFHAAFCVLSTYLLCFFVCYIMFILVANKFALILIWFDLKNSWVLFNPVHFCSRSFVAIKLGNSIFVFIASYLLTYLRYIWHSSFAWFQFYVQLDKKLGSFWRRFFSQSTTTKAPYSVIMNTIYTKMLYIAQNKGRII